MDDEMSRLEQQIARVARESVGPLSKADLEIVTRTAMSTRPRWSLASVFSSARLVVAGVIVALFGGLLFAGVVTQQTEEPVPAPGTSASPSPATAYSVTRVFRGGLWKTVRSIATDEAWWAPGIGTVGRIDRTTSDVTTIPLGADAQWLVSTDDAIWAIAPMTVHRIDRADSNVTDSIDTGSWVDADLGQPLVAHGSLWVPTTRGGSSSLLEIDLAARTLRAEYPTTQVAFDPWSAVIGDAIWVLSDAQGHRLTRFDLATHEFSDPIDVAGAASWSCCIALDDAIWLATEAGEFKRFDVTTREVTDVLALAGESGSSGGPGLTIGAAAAGAIWITSTDEYGGKILRVDLATREVTDVIAVGGRPEPPAFIDGAIWVADHGDKTVRRIDVDSRQVTDTLELPLTHLHTPLGSDGVIWVYTQEGPLFRIDPVTTTE